MGDTDTFFPVAFIGLRVVNLEFQHFYNVMTLSFAKLNFSSVVTQ